MFAQSIQQVMDRLFLFLLCFHGSHTLHLGHKMKSKHSVQTLPRTDTCMVYIVHTGIFYIYYYMNMYMYKQMSNYPVIFSLPNLD